MNERQIKTTKKQATTYEFRKLRFGANIRTGKISFKQNKIMQKIWIITLTIVIAVIFPSLISGQNLDRKFKKYGLAQINTPAVQRAAEKGETITVKIDGRDFNFILTPNDLRARDYFATDTGDEGNRKISNSEVNTFKGKVIGDDDSEVRFTITDKIFEGFIYSGADKIYLMPLKEILPDRPSNEIIVYRAEDVVLNFNFEGDDILRQIETGKAIVEAQNPQDASEMRELEVATESDYEYSRDAGGSEAANQKILSILNLVDGIFERELNITISVTYQHTWTIRDPYPRNVSSVDILYAFTNYWNANFPFSDYPRDVGHIFTKKIPTQGIAFVGAVCTFPDYSYGLTAYSDVETQVVTAHEIAHNLNADHVTGGDCTGAIMNTGVYAPSDRFCQFSKNQINNYISARGSCLVAGGNPTPTPTPTPTPITFNGRR